jgi:hypothetical protein
VEVSYGEGVANHTGLEWPGLLAAVLAYFWRAHAWEAPSSFSGMISARRSALFLHSRCG